VTTTATKRLLILDSVGGLFVGMCVLAFLSPLAALERQATTVLLITGFANIAYGTYSARLAIRAVRGAPLAPTELRILIYANAAWLPVCLALAGGTASHASWLGFAHLVGEGIYVGVLAWFERRVFFAPASAEVTAP
jgi:hypothetical protein